jgi:hypothetical protein
MDASKLQALLKNHEDYVLNKVKTCEVTRRLLQGGAFMTSDLGEKVRALEKAQTKAQDKLDPTVNPGKK